MFSFTRVAFLLCFNVLCYGQFIIPKVTLEAFKPSGFRASIPADSGTEFFAFHGKKNKPIINVEPGEFSGETTAPTNGYFTYYNPNLNFTKGDKVFYWIHVQHNQLGYKKEGQQWTVPELSLQPGTGCIAGSTRVSDRTQVCISAVVFEDNFKGKLDENKWTQEQYIPSDPDYEFVVYKKEAVSIKDNNFCVKPQLINDEEELKKNIDLGDSCTKSDGVYCSRKFFILQNPIISGRVTSKLTFSYGKFEIRARLPSGDWIYPEIYLEDDSSHRILIAYARGNAKLTGNDGKDTGGGLLFGGPVFSQNEPERSSKLASYRHSEPLSKNFHTYTLLWKPDKIQLFVDEVNYGTISTQPGFTGENPEKFRLVFGVGVGGVSDFPDHFKSGTVEKPWINKNRLQVKQFYNQKNQWYPTWGEETRQLQVDYVKVTAI